RSFVSFDDEELDGGAVVQIRIGVEGRSGNPKRLGVTAAWQTHVDGQPRHQSGSRNHICQITESIGSRVSNWIDAANARGGDHLAIIHPRQIYELTRDRLVLLSLRQLELYAEGCEFRHFKQLLVPGDVRP